MKKKISLLIIQIVICFSFTNASTYYVDSNGNDAYTTAQAMNIATPWKTIKKAALMVVGGDVVLVRTGVYTGDIRLRIFGSENNPITFKAYLDEKPIIDLKGNYPASEGDIIAWWFGVVNMLSDYNIIDGFEIRNGTGGTKGSGGGQGIVINGNHNTVKNCIIHNIQDAGVRIKGSYETIDSNQVYDACLNNLNSSGVDWGSGIAISGPNTGIQLTGNVIRNNIVHDVWGEGIYGYYGITNTLMEENIVYNSFALGIGLSGSINGIIRNNLVYKTSDFSGSTGGIAVVNDNTSTKQDICTNNLVCNNFIYGLSIFINRFKASNTSQINDTRIYYNTLVNPEKQPLLLGGNQNNTLIKNNIFVGLWNSTLNTSVAASSNNYWSTIPPTGFGLSSNSDIIGDASLYFAKYPGSVAAGQLTREWFSLTVNSPAINHGVPLSEISTDAFGTIRNTITPEIGAYEYSINADVKNFTSPLFQLFPNPTKGNLTLELSALQVGESVQIYNTMGKLIKELNISSLCQQVNVNDLINGYYFIFLKNHPSQTLKFIKQ